MAEVGQNVNEADAENHNPPTNIMDIIDEMQLLLHRIPGSDDTSALTVENIEGLKQWCRANEGVLIDLLMLYDCAHIFMLAYQPHAAPQAVSKFCLNCVPCTSFDTMLTRYHSLPALTSYVHRHCCSSRSKDFTLLSVRGFQFTVAYSTL